MPLREGRKRFERVIFMMANYRDTDITHYWRHNCKSQLSDVRSRPSPPALNCRPLLHQARESPGPSPAEGQGYEKKPPPCRPMPAMRTMVPSRLTNRPSTASSNVERQNRDEGMANYVSDTVTMSSLAAAYSRA